MLCFRVWRNFPLAYSWWKAISVAGWRKVAADLGWRVTWICCPLTPLVQPASSSLMDRIPLDKEIGQSGVGERKEAIIGAPSYSRHVCGCTFSVLWCHWFLHIFWYMCGLLPALTDADLTDSEGQIGGDAVADCLLLFAHVRPRETPSGNSGPGVSAGPVSRSTLEALILGLCRISQWLTGRIEAIDWKKGKPGSASLSNIRTGRKFPSWSKTFIGKAWIKVCVCVVF